jgi:DNA transposition AAA+ family ATPase
MNRNGNGTGKLTTVGPPPGDEELRLWLVGFMDRNQHLNTVVLSRHDHIGLSRTLLDQYVEGTYFLSRESGGAGVDPKSSKTESRIRAYREKVEGTVRHGYANTFTETVSWKRLVSAWDTAVAENVIIVVYGKPGVGKSRCLTELSVRRMRTMPISIECSPNITVRYFVQTIAQAVGVADHHIIPKMEDLVAEKLKKSPRPIVVDQANYLNEKSLGTICYLWNKARVPILLVGTHELYNLFHTSSLTEDVRAQLSSRVALHYPLPELSRAELKAILKRALGDDISDEVLADVLNSTGGIYRHVDFIIPQIKKLKQRNAEALKSGEVTMAQIVATAGSRLMLS